MSSITPFSTEQSIRDRAGAWISRLDRGIGATERSELIQWLEQSPRHRAVFFEMSELWDRMEILTEISELFPLEAQQWRTAPPRRHRVVWSAAGALVLLLVAVPCGFWLYRSGLSSSAPTAVTITPPTIDAQYRTEIGQQQVVGLPDRSTVELNTDTRVAAHFTASQRTVELLQGEAHFKVAKDSTRVFVVRVGDHQFRAVGTAFNLRMTAGHGVDLTVIEGRVDVLVAPAKDPGMLPGATDSKSVATEIQVDAGKELDIDSAAPTVQSLPPTKLGAAVAWTHGMIVFDGEPLERAIREVGRYSTLQFVIADERTGQIPVAGYFRIGDIEGLVAALQANFGIVASRKDDSIVLRAQHP